jgi:hypothetical protein
MLCIYCEFRPGSFGVCEQCWEMFDKNLYHEWVIREFRNQGKGG